MIAKTVFCSFLENRKSVSKPAHRNRKRISRLSSWATRIQNRSTTEKVTAIWNFWVRWIRDTNISRESVFWRYLEFWLALWDPTQLNRSGIARRTFWGPVVQNPTTKQKDTAEKRWAMIRVRINQINPIIDNFEFAEVRLGAVSPGSLSRIILFYFQWKLKAFLKPLGTDISKIEALGTKLTTPQNPCFLKISIIFTNFAFFSKNTLPSKGDTGTGSDHLVLISQGTLNRRTQSLLWTRFQHNPSTELGAPDPNLTLTHNLTFLILNFVKSSHKPPLPPLA